MTESSGPGLHWGVDIGGTTTIIGHLQDSGFREIAVLNTLPGDPDGMLDSIERTIRSVDDEPASAGAGVAGLVDRSSGMLLSSPNLPGWTRLPLKKKLSLLINCPVTIDNDCNVFALQAIRASRIRTRGLWLMITVGTGIGGTIVNEGSILYGRGYAGEFGHMTVMAGGLPCPCGSRGCWERYASAGALLRYGRSCGSRGKSPLEMAKLADGGDESSIRAFQELGKWLGIGLVDLYHCFSPHGVFMAGGLMGSSHLFLPAAREHFSSSCGFQWNVSLLPSSSTAGAHGAAIMGYEATV